MRPIRLTLQGFKSHEERTEFDFTDRGLFAIVGPTGAGKSTILDGMSFALYGRTPKVQRSTKGLICSTKDSAEIELIFETDGRTFTINRSIRRGSGTPVHVLTDNAGEKVIGESAVTAAVEELMHLDFNAFRSSVLLAQNRFDEFLQATPDTRMKILKGVFRFDQLDAMRDAAKLHRSEHEAAARELEGGLNEIPEDAPELLVAAKTALEELDTSLAALEELRPREKKLQEKRDTAQEKLTVAQEGLSELAELRDELPNPKVMKNLVAVEEEIAAPLEKVTKRVAELKENHGKARTDLRTLEEKFGKETALIALAAKVEKLSELRGGIEEDRAHHAGARAAFSAAEKGAKAATAAIRAAEKHLAGIQEELRALERAHSAHLLRTGLKPGDPCPVCEQEVAKVPRAKLPADLKTVDKSLAKASAVVEDARVSSQGAAEEAAGKRQLVATLDKQITGATEREKELAAQVTAALGKTKDPAAELEARLARVVDSRDALDRLDADLTEARDELETLGARSEEMEETRGEVCDAIAHVATTLKSKRPDRKTSAAELLAAADSLSETLDENERGLRGQIQELGSAATAVADEIAALRREAGIEGDASIEETIAAGREQKGELGGLIKTLEAQIARSAELREKLKKTRREIEVYETLFNDLANTKFIDFLLDDKRRVLSDLASQQLKEMTGRYRFDDSGSFKIVDEFNADTERGIDSLSGGETFLASLALALGLAEAVTRHGGRLRSFFLDEGFGSLDPESLDKALDGIERIVTQDRLIGLVSHVRALAERVTDRIELDRNDAGMTVVVRP